MKPIPITITAAAITRPSLNEEDEPGRPVQDGGDRVPRLGEARLLDRDHRDRQERGDDQRELEEARCCPASVVHALEFDVATQRPRNRMLDIWVPLRNVA